ncbi:MAG: class I tRNA ligase family protein, partial [Nevskiales bacterium]
GLIRDSEGQKMSKSKGNVLDPIDLIDGIDLQSLLDKRTQGLMQPQMAKRIEKATRKEFPEGIAAFGTDAMRFTFAALASTGRDIRFDLGRVAGYRNFCNKLWNAARYVLMNSQDQDTGLQEGDEISLSIADRWIISRLQATEATVNAHFQNYRFDLAAKALYEFTWYEYCDWYLELCKPALTGNADAATQRGTRRSLVRVLETLLRLLHPLMPFITEEIWQQVAPLAAAEGETIMRRPYPQADESKTDTAAEAEVSWIQGFVLGLRQIRGEMDIPPGKPLPVILVGASAQDLQRLESHRATIDFLAKIESVETLDDNAQAPESATALLGSMKILVPMAGLIDKAAECARLEKQISQRQAQVQKGQAKLGNSNFVDRAPADVVEKERALLAEHEQAVKELTTQLERIQSL